MRGSKPALFAFTAVTLGAGVMAGAEVPAAQAAQAPQLATTMCRQYQAIPVAGGRYVVQTDEWGSSARECVSTSGAAGFRVTVSALSNPAAGDPGSYPSIFAGCNWGDCTRGGLAARPLRLRAIAPGSVTTSLATTDPRGGAYDVAYDIWINRAPRTSGAPNGTEVMVWLNRHGGVQPAGRKVAGNVRVGSYRYDVWYSRDAGNGPSVTYEMTTARARVTRLDLGPLFADAARRHYTNPAWYLIAVEAGFEVWHGGAGLAVQGFSVALGKTR